MQEIEANEKRRCELQAMIDEAISNNGNKTYLRVLSQYRLLVNTNYYFCTFCLILPKKIYQLSSSVSEKRYINYPVSFPPQDALVLSAIFLSIFPLIGLLPLVLGSPKPNENLKQLCRIVYGKFV